MVDLATISFILTLSDTKWDNTLLLFSHTITIFSLAALFGYVIIINQTTFHFLPLTSAKWMYRDQVESVQKKNSSTHIFILSYARVLVNRKRRWCASFVTKWADPLLVTSQRRRIAWWRQQYDDSSIQFIDMRQQWPMRTSHARGLQTHINDKITVYLLNKPMS